MIYSFTINIADRHSKPICKQFYLTAENDNAFYRRCLEQYRAQRDVIEILDRIPEKHIDPNIKPEKRIGYKPPKVGIEPEPVTSTKEYETQIAALLSKVRGLGADEIEQKKSEWLVVETQTPQADLFQALTLYKKVKLYYKRTGAKKNKVYIILCKDKKEQSGKRSLKSSSASSKGGSKKKAKKSIQKKNG